MTTSNTPAWPDLFGRATFALAALAGVLLILMMGLIASAVFMRYVMGNPLLGVNEIVQLAAVAITMLALPYATHLHAHVRADIFDPALGRVGRWLADILTRALSIWALWILVGRAWDKAAEAAEFGDATNMLNLPIWPLYALVVLGIGLAIVIFAVQIVLLILTRRAFGEPENG